MKDLPPPLSILIAEGLHRSSSAEQLSSRMTGGLREELERQARWTIDHYAYEDVTPHDGFVITPTGAFHPLTHHLKCVTHDACWDKNVLQFAQAAALYCDRANIVDEVTRLCAFRDISAHPANFNLYRALQAFDKLRPLFDIGLLALVRPSAVDYLEAVEATIPTLVELVRDERNPITASFDGDQLEIVAQLWSPDPDEAFTFRVKVPEEARAAVRAEAPVVGAPFDVRGKQLIERQIAFYVASQTAAIFHDLAVANHSQSTLVGASSVEAMYLAKLRGTQIPGHAAESWESLRSLHLPWVHRLSPQQLLRLRDEATHALPHLRKLLREKLLLTDCVEAVIPKLLDELRSQLADVDAELTGIRSRRAGVYVGAVEGLATAFVLYGLSTSAPPIIGTSIAILLATLANAYTVRKDAAVDAARLASQPAFALLTAKRLLHAR